MIEATRIIFVAWHLFRHQFLALARCSMTKTKKKSHLKLGIFVPFPHQNCSACGACSKNAIKKWQLEWQKLYLPTYALLQHDSLWHHTTGTQLIICGTDHFCIVFVRPMMCVTSHDWDSINYLWDWPLLLAFVRQLKIQNQPSVPGKFRSYD